MLLIKKVFFKIYIFFIHETALHYAARGRNKKIIKILLENGANPEIANNQGIKPAINDS